MSIGKPIDPKGLKAEEINSQVENWIETEMNRIKSEAALSHVGES
jgi:1-acyl-sn-glycerol-3-phosphate acyltransferase